VTTILLCLLGCAAMIWLALRVAAKRKRELAAMVERERAPFKAPRTPPKPSKFYRTKGYDEYGRKLPNHPQRASR